MSNRTQAKTIAELNSEEQESEWGSCVRCGREDKRGEFVELLGQATPDNPDGGTGDPICPTCIALSEAEAREKELLEILDDLLDATVAVDPFGDDSVFQRARAAIARYRERKG